MDRLENGWYGWVVDNTGGIGDKNGEMGIYGQSDRWIGTGVVDMDREWGCGKFFEMGEERGKTVSRGFLWTRFFEMVIFPCRHHFVYR